jgi:hypothetical protein
MRIAKIIIILAVVIFLSIQFVPVDRSNPQPTGDIKTPENIKSLLHRSCYDCHSFETIWPWYSYIAPASWLVVSDVHEARQYMNFSIWNTYSESDAKRYIRRSLQWVKDGEMPLPQYLLLHPDAKIVPSDLKMLEKWVADSAVEDEE